MGWVVDVGVRPYAHPMEWVFGQFIGALLLIGLVGTYFWWIVDALVAVGLVYFRHGWWLAEHRRVVELEAKRAAIAVRADQRHAWVIAGDAGWRVRRTGWGVA